MAGQQEEPTPATQPDRYFLGTAAGKALAFLAGEQDVTGDFRLYLCRTRDMCDLEPDSSVFATMQIIHSLADLPFDAARELHDRAAAFVLSRMEPPGIWRYWGGQVRSLPVDLDTSACGAACLAHDHAWLAFRLNAPLLQAWRDPEGRFWTWIGKGANDVDSVVNANVVWYLGESAATRGAVQWVAALVRAGQEPDASFYYDDPLALYYAVGRAIQAGVESWRSLGPLLEQRLRARFLDRTAERSALAQARALAALCAIGAAGSALAARLARGLLREQRGDGSWPLAPAWNGGFPPGPRRLWWGSEALTTALCLESLNAWNGGRGPR